MTSCNPSIAAPSMLAGRRCLQCRERSAPASPGASGSSVASSHEIHCSSVQDSASRGGSPGSLDSGLSIASTVPVSSPEKTGGAKRPAPDNRQPRIPLRRGGGLGGQRKRRARGLAGDILTLTPHRLGAREHVTQ